MTVPVSVHLSDSGTPLDPGARRVLEGSFAVDLSGIRLHAGPRADAFLQARGYPAATCGHRVFMPARRPGGSARWLHVLAHEIVHAIQQAQGIERTGGFWERHAEAGAMAVTSGRVYPDLGLRPPGRGHGAAVLAGFNSWEHRLIGDVPSVDLVRVATRTAGWQDVVAQQIGLVRLWQDGGTEVTVHTIRRIVPDIGLVTLPGSGCLASYGEINAVADYAASAEAVTTLPARYMFAFLQQIRQESFNYLSGLLGIRPQNPDFAGAVTPYLDESGSGAARETRLIDTFTLPLGVNHYRGLLARNACHFAPFAWQRWRQAHAAARDLARKAWEAADPGETERLANLAWVAQGYADHFVQDSFAPGHLANKTLIMQWFVEWADDSLFVPVKDWGDVRFVTAGNQPALMGAPLYDSRCPGPSNDPQAAEEQGDPAARMAATGIRAYGSITREQAYRQYLRFLEATVVQLSSKKIHDHFNEHGLDVTSSGHPGVFRIYGDGKLLSNGADVSIAAGTVAASRAVISDIIASGHSRTPPWEIIDMLPAWVVGSSGRPVSLPDWHDSDLKNQAPDLFRDARSMFRGITSPSLGIVSEDHETAGPLGHTSHRTRVAAAHLSGQCGIRQPLSETSDCDISG